MYARRVTMRLMKNSIAEFNSLFEKNVLPLLRKQAGFKDEITFLDEGDQDALAISLWDRREDADAYGQAKYPEVVKMLSKVVDGTPHVHGGAVFSSTFHKLNAAAAKH